MRYRSMRLTLSRVQHVTFSHAQFALPTTIIASGLFSLVYVRDAVRMSVRAAVTPLFLRNA
jgi:hypothetical protein